MNKFSIQSEKWLQGKNTRDYLWDENSIPSQKVNKTLSTEKNQTNQSVWFPAHLASVGHGYKFKERKFSLDIRTKFFTVRWARH